MIYDKSLEVPPRSVHLQYGVDLIQEDGCCQELMLKIIP